MIPQGQLAHVAPRSWFLNAILQQKEPRLFRKKGNSRIGKRKIQDEPGAIKQPPTLLRKMCLFLEGFFLFLLNLRKS